MSSTQPKEYNLHKNLVLVVRYSSELSIKGPQAKKHFVEKLKQSIHFNLNRKNIFVEIQYSHDGLFLEIQNSKNDENISNLKGQKNLDKLNEKKELVKVILKDIFGISSFSFMAGSCSVDYEQIKKTGAEVFAPTIENKSFAVRVKKLGTHNFKSTHLERELGGILNTQVTSSKVSLKKPDVTAQVYVSNKKTYFYFEKYLGAQGLPMGTEERALCLMSGGYDSAVAAWQIMKRGVPVDFLFCNLAGRAYERKVLEVTKVLCDRWSASSQPKFYSLDFNPIIDALKENVDNTYRQVILKRIFYKVADHTAFHNNYMAIITGEAIGQVSSQTLTNLNLIHESARLQVLRPIISFDKTEIIDRARKIGTADLSEKIKEYCSISKGQPVTKGKKPRALNEEAKLPEDLISSVLSNIKVISTNDLNLDELYIDYLLTKQIPQPAVIIDCQDPKDFNSWHIGNAKNHSFQEVMNEFNSWDKDKTYFLYCSHGTQTPLAAEKMQSMGFDAYCYKGDVESLKKSLIEG